MQHLCRQVGNSGQNSNPPRRKLNSAAESSEIQGQRVTTSLVERCMVNIACRCRRIWAQSAVDRCTHASGSLVQHPEIIPNQSGAFNVPPSVSEHEDRVATVHCPSGSTERFLMVPCVLHK
jgi:hypothetical protein